MPPLPVRKHSILTILTGTFYMALKYLFTLITGEYVLPEECTTTAKKYVKRLTLNRLCLVGVYRIITNMPKIYVRKNIFRKYAKRKFTTLYSHFSSLTTFMCAR